MKTRRQFRKRWGRAFQVEETSRERERDGRGGERRHLIVFIFWKYYLRLGKDYLDMTPKACTIKESN